MALERGYCNGWHALRLSEGVVDREVIHHALSGHATCRGVPRSVSERCCYSSGLAVGGGNDSRLSRSRSASSDTDPPTARFSSASRA